MPPEVSKYMSFMALDAPRHTKLKRLVSTAFTPRAVAALTERVTERARMIVDELINHGPGDFHELVSKRLPLWAISEMVGVPEDERKALGELTDDMEHINDPSFAVKYPGVDPYEFNVQGLARMAELGRRLAAERRQRPQNDLMTALVQASVDGEKLSDEEIGDFFDLLISAGYATTVHNISIGLHALSQFPGNASCCAPTWTATCVRLSRRCSDGRPSASTSGAPQQRKQRPSPARKSTPATKSCCSCCQRIATKQCSTIRGASRSPATPIPMWRSGRKPFLPRFPARSP